MKRSPHRRPGGLLPACALYLAANTLAGAVVLLALGGLGAVVFSVIQSMDPVLAAAPIVEPAAYSGKVAGYGSPTLMAGGGSGKISNRQGFATQQLQATPSNYDSDGDGLIEVTSVQQLNAVRYDLDGDGSVTDADESALYAAAFPVTSDGSVCPSGTTCTGYELTADLDLDTNGDGEADSGDTYWNGGKGWQPIGELNDGFAATFEGNGWSISNLFINRSTNYVGLFGAVDDGADIRNVGLVDLSVTGGGYVGGLAGRLDGVTVSGCSSTGSVAGSSSRIGGLVGYGQNSIIEDSWSSANVTAMGNSGSARAGGLVGELQGTGTEGGVKSVVRRSYATGTVSSDQSRIGGLVGNLYKGTNVPAQVVASYATGAVSGSTIVGGLVGRNQGEVKAGYATGAVSSTSNSKTGGLVGDNRGPVTASYATGAVSGTSGNVGGLVGSSQSTPTASYFDSDTSGQSDSTQGKTTKELQEPTGYSTPASNIFSTWNVDLDGDGANDDPWDFGFGLQYPVLKVDGSDGDTTATWQEFGNQLRTRPGLAVSTTTTSATLTWTAPAATTDYAGTPSVTYQVYRDGTSIGTAQTSVTYTNTGLTTGFNHKYRVCVLLNGEPARCSHTVTAPPPLSISIADASGNEGGNASFTVSKTGTGAVTLGWKASIGGSDTAASGDLGATTYGRVSFASADTSETFTVATAQDTTDESNETFTVTLTPLSGSANLTDGTAAGTITDDDESAGAPTSLTAATGSNVGEIDLSWTAPSDTGELNGTDPATITGYQYRSAESSAGLTSATWTSAGTGTTFTVTSLTGGKTYYFQVRALNGVTPEGAASTEASGTAKGLSSNANLSALAVSQGTLSPQFSSTVTAYTATVANSTASMTVTPTAADSDATITVDGTAVTSGEASGAIDLDIGSNSISVVVMAENGTTTKTYTVTVTRSSPGISIADASGKEGGNASFTVSKTGTGAVTLSWKASIGDSDTATTGDLGTTTSGTVAFTASETSKTVAVATVEDTTDESNETFTVTLTVSTGIASLTDGTASGTITDDDESAGAPTSLTAATGSNAGEVDLSWTAPSDTGELNGTDPAAITGYQYRSAESRAGLSSATWKSAGTGTAYTVTSLTGGTTYYFQVRALNGVTPEGAASNEASAAAKSPSSDANLSALSVSQGTLSPGFKSTVTAYTATVANSTASMTVTPTASDSDATITVDGTAVGSGEASGAVDLDIGSNSISVVVTAENATTKTYTITVTRSGPSISIADASGNEGSNVSFTVSKTGTGAVTLSWKASIGDSDTATTGDLGTTTSGTVAFTSSETSKTFSVATVEDAMDESNETFTVTLTVSSGTASLTDGTAAGTITDDDESAGAPSSLTAVTGSGTGEVDLSWTAPSDTGELNGTDPAAITGYQYRKAESSMGLASATWTNAGTATTFTVTGLTGGTTYYFQVRALNGVTPEGTASDEASAAAKSPSSDANLSALSVSQGTLSPAFDAGKIAYTATVANSVASMTVTPTAADSDATITVNNTAVTSGEASGAVDLDIGSNSISVVVTAENATTKTYTITVTRSGPSISIADASGNEGRNVSFTVSKTGTGAVTLGWTASIGDSDTATTGDLGTTTSGTVAFTSSETSKTFSVATKQDAEDESDETFTVKLSISSGTASLTDGTAAGTITDDDESAGAPSSLTAVTGSGTGEVDLSWTAPSDTGELNGTDPATITGYQYRKAESSTGLTSATWTGAGTGTTHTVASLTGGTTYYFQVRALNGVTPKGTASDEASAAAKSPSSDADLSALAVSQGTLSPAFDAGKIAYTATVANSVASMTVTPTASDSKATLTVDGTAVGSGEASGAIDLDIGSNSISVVVTAENATTKTYTITVTRSGPSISIADASGNEGSNVSFTVSKTGTGAVTLSWKASIGDSDTATTGDLGTTTSGTVAFTSSETSKTFSVATVEDAMDESNETFTVTLTVSSGTASLTDGTAAGTITDDDESAGAPSSLTAVTGSGTGEVDLSWTAPSDTGELNGTDPAAITGYQYRKAESSMGLASATWTNAGTATTFTVTGLTGGTTYYFQVRALNGVTPKGAASDEASAAAKALPSISIADASGGEGGNVSFTVSKTGTGAVTLGWTASIGESDTAKISDLGTPTSGTVAFTSSEDSKTVAVATKQDAEDESDETFTVTLTISSGAANLTDETAAGTITDDDESAGAPTSLTAATGSDVMEIDLSWTVPSDTGGLNGTDPAAITGYQYRKAETSVGLTTATWASAGTGTTFTVTDLPGGTTYYFQARALNGATPEGAASDDASAEAKALSCNPHLSGAAISWGTALSGGDDEKEFLIEVATVEQLNAVRYDLDGDGVVVDNAETVDVNEAELYAAAFSVTPGGSACPDGKECTGYILTADLDLDTNGNGTADAGDDFWNEGDGWQPIGEVNNAGFAAIFDGDGKSISNLFIDRSGAANVGLFGVVSEGSEIRNVALAGICVTGRQYVGGLVGRLEEATVSGASAAGAVAGSSGRIGGLIGHGLNSIIEDSWASVDVTAMGTGSHRAVGGLVGEFQVIGQASDVKRVVQWSYATGTVSSNLNRVGGLVGNMSLEGPLRRWWLQVTRQAR